MHTTLARDADLPAAWTTIGRLGIALAFFVYCVLVARQSFVCDDAYISFRYARHLATGAGLCFNLGESPPVEGYTDLGWVLWMALFERFGADPTFWSRATSTACGALLFLWVVSFARRSFPRGFAGPLACAFFLATWPPLLVWTTGGLGTLPFALFVFGAFERLLGTRGCPRTRSAVLFALGLILLRADGIFWVAALAGLSLLELRTLDPVGRRRLLRAIVVVTSAVVLVSVLHTLWRQSYHGDWLPNTARAKVAFSLQSSNRGFHYLVSHWLMVPASAVVLLVGAGIGLFRRVRSMLLASAMVAATFAYGVLVSGDFMTSARFYVPAGAFLAVLAGGIVDRIAGLGTPRRTRIALATTLAIVGLSLPSAFDLHVAPLALRESWDFRWRQRYVTEYQMWADMRDRARNWAQLGRALGLHTRPGESLVRSTIGGVGYYSELVIHDQYGIVDREVVKAVPNVRLGTPGHDRMVDAEFFDDREPTYANAYVQPASAPTLKSGPFHAVERIPLAVEDGFPENRVLILVRRPRR